MQNNAAQAQQLQQLQLWKRDVLRKIVELKTALEREEAELKIVNTALANL
jgi:hypothetical protein